MFRSNLFFCAFLFFAFLTTAQEKSPIIPSISLEPLNKNMVAISGLCTNFSSQSKEFKYILSVQKRSRYGNTNNNNQRGNFNIAPEETKKLSTTTINFEPLDDTQIILTILDVHNDQIAQYKKTLTEADLIKN